MKDISVGMFRSHMNDIPQHALPDGFHFRPISGADAETWVHIQNGASLEWGGVSMKTFEGDFSGHEEKLPDRSWFVIDPDGKAIASITAWWHPDDVSLGLIHWVAVTPGYQGKGLGKAIMTKAMNRLAWEYPTAYLNTSTARIAAVKVYLDFGFLPDLKKDKADEGWAEMRENLRHPALGNG
jgi:GNAT superfamily N-acetyltransferase